MGAAKLRIDRGGGLRRAAKVAGPATPSAPRPAQAWNRCSAASPRGPSCPSNVPDGKPCVASSHWSAATSQPLAAAPIAPAQRAARARADDAVDGQALPRLQPAHGVLRRRAADAVDRGGVSRLGAQRDLESCGVGAPCLRD
jgi:hypothetical protein